MKLSLLFLVLALPAYSAPTTCVNVSGKWEQVEPAGSALLDIVQDGCSFIRLGKRVHHFTQPEANSRTTKGSRLDTGFEIFTYGADGRPYHFYSANDVSPDGRNVHSNQGYSVYSLSESGDLLVVSAGLLLSFKEGKVTQHPIPVHTTRYKRAANSH